MEYWKDIKIKTFSGKVKKILDFTQEELIYEKVKCATDPIYVIETYFKIFDQTKNNGKGEIVPFILFPFQKDLVKSYEKNRFNITNKYRQAGISTVTCAYLATYIAFNSNRSVAIVANKLETARDELMKDVTDFIDMLPPFLHPKIAGKDAANHKRYGNGSQVKAFATNSLRGYTPTFLFWDESAWCDNGEDFWTGTLPTLSTGGNAALVSCVSKDTMVWSDDGLNEMTDFIDLKKTDSYVIDEYNILGRFNKRKGHIIKNNGFGKTKKILSEHVSLEGTLSHKLWTYNNHNGKIGYQPLNRVNKESYIALQFGSKSFGTFDTIKYLPIFASSDYFNYKLTNKFSKLLALVYIKGNVVTAIRNRKPYTTVTIDKITEYDRNIINEFMDEFNNDYPEYKILEKDVKFSDNTYVLTHQSVTYIFNYLDLNFTGVNNTIYSRPFTKLIKKFRGDLLFTFAKEYINQIEDKIIQDGKFMVKINTITIGRQIQQILLNWGIVCGYNDYVDLTGKSQGDRYLSIDLDYDYFMDNDNFDHKLFDQYLPLGIMHNVRELLIKNNLELPFGKYTKFQLIDIVDRVKDLVNKDDLVVISRILAKDIYWSKVYKTIKGYNQTYDFSLPNNDDDFWAHSVIYNGIIGHQTPNGLDPVFYKTFNNAKNGMNDFIANELYWYLDPRYSIGLKWKKKNDDGVEIEKIENDPKKFKKLLSHGWSPWSPWFESMSSQFNYDKKRIAQEILGSFLGSGNNFIDEVHIKRIEEGEICDPIRMEYDDFFWIWEDPIKDKLYVMTVDVSTGAGDDFSTIIILKQEETHLEQVAEFKHKVSPDTLGVISNDYGKRYNNAFAIVDITGGIGAMTAKTMLDLGYNNMYYTVNRHEPTKEKLSDYLKEDENGKTLVPGFVITTSNRGMVLTEMKRAIESSEIMIKSYRLISEFKTFITTPNSRIADHRRSFNDDLIIALAMGIYVFSYDIKSVGISIEKTKTMLSAITTSTKDYKTGEEINNNNNRTNPNNHYVANNWLFKGLKGFR